MVVPAAFSSQISSCIFSVVAGSRPDVGSSRYRISISFNNALQKFTRLRIPFDSFPTTVFLASDSSTNNIVILFLLQMLQPFLQPLIIHPLFQR